MLTGPPSVCGGRKGLKRQPLYPWLSGERQGVECQSGHPWILRGSGSGGCGAVLFVLLRRLTKFRSSGLRHSRESGLPYCPNNAVIPEKKTRRIVRINTPEDRPKAYPFVITAGNIRLPMVPPMAGLPEKQPRLLLRGSAARQSRHRALSAPFHRAPVRARQPAPGASPPGFPW